MPMHSSHTLKIRFFGPFTLSLGEKKIGELGERGSKQWRLIKYLILNRSRAVGKRELIDATFGYGSYIGRDEDALNALNAMLHRARRTLAQLGLEPDKVIIFEKDSYRFIPPESTEIDHEVFEELSAKIFSGDALGSVKSHALRALELYTGFFLDKKYIDEKSRQAAERYHDIYKRIFSLACGILSREKDFLTIYELADRALMSDPLCEEFHIRRISAYLELGEKGRARELYGEAFALFESRTELIPSERFRALGDELGDGDTARIILPEKYAEREDDVRRAVESLLGAGAKVKISLI